MTPRTPGWRQRSRRRIRERTGGEDRDIVSGRDTPGAVVHVVREGGIVVTCASTTGHMHQCDDRYLRRHLERITGSQVADHREARGSDRLVDEGPVHPMLPKVPPTAGIGQAAHDLHRDLHLGRPLPGRVTAGHRSPRASAWHAAGWTTRRTPLRTMRG